MAEARVNFRAESDELYAFLNAFRKRLHQGPELSGEEVQTCQAIRDELMKIGVEADGRFASPNTVALVFGACPGPTVALARPYRRAAPIQKGTTCPTIRRVTALCMPRARCAYAMYLARILPSGICVPARQREADIPIL